MSQESAILVATEVVADAEIIRKSLAAEFDSVAVCTNPASVANEFDMCRPAVLVLAVETLEKAELYYLDLFRHSSAIHSCRHKSVVLCSKEEVGRAYELCKKRIFDDYVLFWPMTHDTSRLAMSVHHALWQLAAEASIPAPSVVSTNAACLADLPGILDEYAARGAKSIEAAGHFLHEQGVDIRAALQPVRDWAGSLAEDLAPQIDAAAAIGELEKEISRLVLVVDDDEFQTKLVAQILGEIGIEVTGAASATQAFVALCKRQPNLILMDFNLPDGDGIELTRRIKTIERFGKIPVIMVTGQSGKDIVVDSLRAGVADFVVKPFGRAVILDKVSRFLL